MTVEQIFVPKGGVMTNSIAEEHFCLGSGVFHLGNNRHCLILKKQDLFKHLFAENKF